MTSFNPFVSYSINGASKKKCGALFASINSPMKRIFLLLLASADNGDSDRGERCLSVCLYCSLPCLLAGTYNLENIFFTN